MIEVRADDPTSADVQALLRAHLDHSSTNTPPEHAHALDIDGLLDPAVTFFSARERGRLCGIGALRELDEHTGELKSMHTVADRRRSGIGRLMLEHLLGECRRRGYQRALLETGTMEAYAAAKAMYLKAGFVERGPFGAYQPSPSNAFMELELGGGTDDCG